MNRLATFSIGAVASAAMLWASQADARPARVDEVPNGFRRACSTCHTSPGGGARNSFGLDVEETMTEPGAAGITQWNLIFELDSDGDGATNGEELGDPNGEWQIGDMSPAFQSDPANPADTPPECGNGAVEGDEECDGGDLDGEDCDSLDFDGGELGCNEDCTLNIDACIEPEPDPNPEPVVEPEPNPDPNPEPNPEPEPEPDPEPEGEPTPEPTDEDEGCTTAPGQSGSTPIVFVLGLLGLAVLRRRNH